MNIYSENALTWKWKDLTDENFYIVSGNSLVSSGNMLLLVSILTRYMSPYGVTRPEWVIGQHLWLHDYSVWSNT